ncbi:MAG: hypothetical protein ACXWV9_07790 [Flavisolibacter sp.]
MKQFFLPALFAGLLLSCNNDKKVTATETSEDGTTTSTSVDVKGMSDAADEMNKKMEALKKLTPLTTDQLKALLPQEINGINQTEYNTSAAMGYALAQGEYKKDDTTEIELQVYDCAGEAGSAWYSMTYWSAMNFQQENSREYTKTIDFNGGKAIEQYNKENHESTLTYNANERLLVVLKGRNVTPDELKSIAAKLNLKI